ncbi:zinc finger CCCH domain-containing protein 18-like [Impatiens glandulifera]|uniref:zinc finger CCCH domain-containing protein 18-like n=1 Tax=Impatiens glandulifera TaxID=253017 RepID=UPI001FB0B887|nr:zinc finger CCCH domain-containing protein 18-like [Impatiens glandulifera]
MAEIVILLRALEWSGDRFSTRLSARKSSSLTDQLYPFNDCTTCSMKGLYCIYGNNCMCNIHANQMNESDHVLMHSSSNPGSMEKLEMELIELLRSRKGVPISIASLPTFYLEKYGKPLEAEGMVKLVATLPSFLDTLMGFLPHGQHSVELAEHGPSKYNYSDILSQRNHSRSWSWLSARGDHHQSSSSSTQIYLTFPPESTFTDRDVYNYFNKIGDVQDVRLPYNQLKRKYGFVAFVLPDTVTKILSRQNHHFICGARVLVKPYLDKSQLMHKKLLEKSRQQFNSYSQLLHSLAIIEQRRMMEGQQYSLAHHLYINGYMNFDQYWKLSFYEALERHVISMNMSGGGGSTSSTSNEEQNSNIGHYNLPDSPRNIGLYNMWVDSPFTSPMRNAIQSSSS